MRSGDDVDATNFLRLSTMRRPEGQFTWKHHVYGGGEGHLLGLGVKSNVHRTVEHGANQRVYVYKLSMQVVGIL